MIKQWTFGRTIAAGFAAVLALNLVGGAIALIGLRSVVAAKDRVINQDSQLQLISQQLLTARAERAAALRAYLITGISAFADETNQADADFTRLLSRAEQMVHTPRGKALLTTVTGLSTDSQGSLEKLITLKRDGASPAAVDRAFRQQTAQRAALKSALGRFNDYEEGLAATDTARSKATAEADVRLIVGSLIATILAIALLGILLTRRLRSRIGSAVGEVASSSVELQTTANQQATGAMEQATAMSEISMTITQLLASSQQIAESAQRVADVADQTATAGRSGQDTVTSAQALMTEIRNQVDVIVDHMIELGDKSQRIGAVLDIVSELSEQTNILAINSTIEAAGAGESGRRFAVVADEIRKLADRVAESTKEIRGLIELIRGAVHTTVMATEIGSKAVDAGTAQFVGVAQSFGQIVDLVTTTTEAAREIELSTRQQTTAVEQVNFAVANVTETTKENESGTTQTLQTASQLAELSTRLRRLVDAAPGA